MPEIRHDEITIFYEAYGNKKHPCIILIMGISGQLIHWPEEIIQMLVARGFYVVTFDNRDAGLSSKYDHLHTPSIMEAMIAKSFGQPLTPPYLLNDMAADVIVLMDNLGIQTAHIAGISMGGMIGQVLAIEYPERVSKLICIATSSGDPNLPPASPEVMEFFFAPKKPVTDLETYLESVIQHYKVYHHPDDYDFDKVRELASKAYHRAHYPEGFTRQLLAIIASEPRTEKLKNVKAPSLIIHGDYDPAFPVEHGKHLAGVIPNSRLEIIEKMGHGLPERLYEEIVNLTVDFIQS